MTVFVRAGFRIETVRKYPTATYEAFGPIEESESGRYRISGDPLPPVYALKASTDGN